MLRSLPVGDVWGIGPAYKKAGVRLQTLEPVETRPGHLFRERVGDDDALMTAVDRLNREMGRDPVGFAAGVGRTRLDDKAREPIPPLHHPLGRPAGSTGVAPARSQRRIRAVVPPTPTRSHRTSTSFCVPV